MFCPSCGIQVPNESSFCLKCGRSMAIAPNAMASGADTGSAPPHRRGAVAWAIAAAAIGIASVCAYVYAGPRANSGSATSRIASAQSGVEIPTSKPSPTVPTPIRLSPGDIAAKFSDAVVILESYDRNGLKAAQGSGFIISPDGKVLTNYHVIRGSSRMVARTHDQATHEVEYIAEFDVQHDLASIKISGNNLPSVHLGNSITVKTGDHVTALGAPLGLESTLSDGIISAIREAGTFRVFQTSTPISHGSSGGPLFDDYGDVIALAVATVEAGENLNFAVPIDAARPLKASERQTTFTELLSTTEVRQPILSSSVSVPPQVTGIDVVVPQQGGLLAGSFSIAGGMRNDLGVKLVAATGASVWDGGVMQNYVTLNVPLRGGRYKLVFNNKMGPFWVSPKTLSGTVELSYYR